MSKITLEKNHALLEKLAEYVMNEVARKSEVPTKQEVNEKFQQIDNRFQQFEGQFQQIEGRFQQIEGRFQQIEGRFQQIDNHFKQMEYRMSNIERDMYETKENTGIILNGLDKQAKQTETLQIEQLAIKSGLNRIEKRVDVLEESK